jgi:hypothetical protein
LATTIDRNVDCLIEDGPNTRVVAVGKRSWAVTGRPNNSDPQVRQREPGDQFLKRRSTVDEAAFIAGRTNEVPNLPAAAVDPRGTTSRQRDESGRQTRA